MRHARVFGSFWCERSARLGVEHTIAQRSLSAGAKTVPTSSIHSAAAALGSGPSVHRDTDSDMRAAAEAGSGLQQGMLHAAGSAQCMLYSAHGVDRTHSHLGASNHTAHSAQRQNVHRALVRTTQRTMHWTTVVRESLLRSSGTDAQCSAVPQG